MIFCFQSPLNPVFGSGARSVSGTITEARTARTLCQTLLDLTISVLRRTATSGHFHRRCSYASPPCAQNFRNIIDYFDSAASAQCFYCSTGDHAFMAVSCTPMGETRRVSSPLRKILVGIKHRLGIRPVESLVQDNLHEIARVLYW